MLKALVTYLAKNAKRVTNLATGKKCWRVGYVNPTRTLIDARQKIWDAKVAYVKYTRAMT